MEARQKLLINDGIGIGIDEEDRGAITMSLKSRSIWSRNSFAVSQVLVWKVDTTNDVDATYRTTDKRMRRGIIYYSSSTKTRRTHKLAGSKVNGAASIFLDSKTKDTTSLSKDTRQG